MNAEFNWWLLIVGLVVGAGLVYIVLADSSRREAEIEEEELPHEAAWIATAMRAEGAAIQPETAERVLLLHREYLAGPPPDEPLGEAPPAMPPTVDPGRASETADRSDRSGGPGGLGEAVHAGRVRPRPASETDRP